MLMIWTERILRHPIRYGSGYCRLIADLFHCQDFMIVSLDLISGLISSIPVRHMESLIEESHLVHLLLRCAAVSLYFNFIFLLILSSLFLSNRFISQDPMPEVRQSTFAVLGDLVKNCFHLVQPVVSESFIFSPI